ncbi:hypothetical protein BH10PLA2_BH10PLA2_05060 [soil metagenome]
MTDFQPERPRVVFQVAEGLSLAQHTHALDRNVLKGCGNDNALSKPHTRRVVAQAYLVQKIALFETNSLNLA